MKIIFVPTYVVTLSTVKQVVIYLYGFEYGLVKAKAQRNIFHKMDTCILGYESECASNRPASKHRFSHNVGIFGLSCPLETCKSKHNNNFILALLASIWGQNCDRMQFWYAHSAYKVSFEEMHGLLYMFGHDWLPSCNSPNSLI